MSKLGENYLNWCNLLSFPPFYSKMLFMKKIFSLLIAGFAFSVGIAQKTINDPNVEVRQASGFHAIEVGGGIDLYLSAGDEAVAVSANSVEARNKIRTEVRNGVLKISFDWKDGLKFSLKGDKHLKAYVSYKTLDALSASGGSDVHVDGVINSNNLRLDVSGGSDFDGKVQIGSKLNISASGGSDVNISGSASDVSIDASGGSDFDGYDLATETCDISASGGSDINITVNKELSAEASGASDISWKGKATVKKAKASGAGSVSQRS